MKKILLLIMTLLIPTYSFANACIPFILGLGSNLFIVDSLLPPFCFGLLLFAVVCYIENYYLKKKLNLKNNIYGAVTKANLLSTLVGVILTFCIYASQSLPKLEGTHGGVSFLVTGYFVDYIGNLLIDKGIINEILAAIGVVVFYMFIFWLFSWLVEYFYLKKRLGTKLLKRHVLMANVFSYIVLNMMGWGLFILSDLYFAKLIIIL